jgi:hypothetical protein
MLHLMEQTSHFILSIPDRATAFGQLIYISLIFATKTPMHHPPAGGHQSLNLVFSGVFVIWWQKN